ncbi:molybdopterin molybdotransferase MoeA [Microbacterium esteraromaticum]|uniref:molybdopterin molybdotransferase MoeA n=1 Tax=Microbacterium esteraromaticum TaxID=57043 RepID=UPI002368AF7A|nr:gephyrin-like molybdotransferase Glp [Microbacterium esteraromaticum]WDH78472.1 molybdopterin molybdotransferase MoeA [Microbacterium esteraromaticum]
MTYRAVEEQLALVLAAVRQHPPQRVAVDQAHGFTLAVDARAASAVPAFDNSAMDGFAVRRDDVVAAAPDYPVTLRVVADVPAGSAHDPELRAGECARIMTGAAVPSSADAIVPFEDTVGGLTDSQRHATVLRAPVAGAYIRSIADDIAAGDVALAAGAHLGARQLGALAGAGVATVEVSPRPRLAIVSTGSELVAPGRPLHRGQIPESNGILLAALAAEAGAEVALRRVISDDDHGGVADVIADAQRHGVDAVVFSGGVSAGAYEIVKQSLAHRMEFTSVGMQPGKPQGFGTTEQGMLLFGLPGNPVSAAVSFEVFVRPALLHMQRRTALHRPRLRLPAGADWRTPPGRRQYLPAVIDRTDPARPVVRPASAGGSGSHLSVGLGAAEVYAIVPADTERVRAGDLIDVMELR